MKPLTLAIFLTGKERDAETGLDYFGASVHVGGAGAVYNAGLVLDTTADPVRRKEIEQFRTRMGQSANLMASKYFHESAGGEYKRPSLPLQKRLGGDHDEQEEGNRHSSVGAWMRGICCL